MADRFEKNPTIYVDMNNFFPVLNERVGLNYEQVRKIVENSNFLKNYSDILKGESDELKISLEDLESNLESNLENLESSLKELIDELKEYVKTNYVSDVLIGNGSVNFVDDIKDAKLELSANKIEYMEGAGMAVGITYSLYLPKDKVQSVNGQTGNVVITAEDLGINPDNFVPKTAGTFYINNTPEGIIISDRAPLQEGETPPTTGVFSTREIRIDSSNVQISNFTTGKTSYGSAIQWQKQGRPLLILNGEVKTTGEIATLTDIENAIGNVSSLLGDTEDLEV